MNILVTGANGQLARSIESLAKNSNDTFIYTDIAGDYEILDITDLEGIKDYVKAFKISCIINCAAFTDVEGAEQDVFEAHRVNAVGAANLAEAMQEVSGLLVHISSDYVFGREAVSEPISESAPLSPVNAYGISKADAEQLILDSGCKSIIIRTGWLYSEFGHNFVKTIRSLTCVKESIKVVNDQIGSPTYAADLAKVILKIISERLYEDRCGIYNYSNEGAISWFDFAKEIAAVSGHRSCEILPCSTAEYPTEAPRPQYSVLDKSKIVSTFGIEIPAWQDSLKECISKL